MGKARASPCWAAIARVDQAGGAVLADVLPPLILARSGSRQATVLQWLLDQLAGEHGAALPGATIASAQLAQLMFVHLLRASIEHGAAPETGWLRAVGDERLAPALRLIHANPGRPWHLPELAKAAAMSRTSFAARFRAVAGVAPLAYVTQWRMRLAQRAPRKTLPSPPSRGSSVMRRKLHSATRSSARLASRRSAYRSAMMRAAASDHAAPTERSLVKPRRSAHRPRTARH